MLNLNEINENLDFYKNVDNLNAIYGLQSWNLSSSSSSTDLFITDSILNALALQQAVSKPAIVINSLDLDEEVFLINVFSSYSSFIYLLLLKNKNSIQD